MINGTRYRLSAEINRQGDLAREIARLQTEIATGKRIIAPSDDPTGSARIAEIGRTQADEKAYSRNLDFAAGLAERADTALRGISTVVGRARELMLVAASDTVSASQRGIIAAELRDLSEQVVTLADSRDNRGALLFRSGDPLEIPAAAGIRLVAVASRAEVFGAVPTAAGPQSFVQLLADAVAALEEPDAALRRTAIGESLDEFKAAVEHVAALAGQQGVRGARIEAMQDRAADASLQLTEERVGIESADITEVVARLQSRQLSLQAAQAVFARINQTGLFDLLR